MFNPLSRLFVGAPVRVDGHGIGVLCLFGAEPRTLSDIERTMLLELRTTVEHWLVGLRERLQLEARTREFRELAEQMPGIVYRAVMDEASSTLYVSSRVRELGYTPEEWMARPDAWMQALHPDDCARVLAELADAGVTHAAMEASSHGLSQYRLDGVKFTASALKPSHANGFSGSFTAFQPNTGRKKSHENNML